MEQQQVDTQRRKLLTGALGLGGVGTAVGLGVLAPSQALASWREESIMATSLEEGLNAVLGATDYEESDEIRIDAP